MGEVIDLTTESPPPEGAGSKRGRDEASGSGEEERQRQRIIQFATSLAAGTQPQLEGHAGPVQSQSELRLPGEHSADEGAARLQIMRFTADVRAGSQPPSEAASTPAAPGTSLLAQLHAERIARRGLPPSATPTERPAAAAPAKKICVLSFNVWFREDVCLQARMHSLGKIVADSGYPEVIALQEVTPSIYALFEASPWWRRYTARPGPAEPLAAYFTMLLWRTDAAASSGYAAIPFQNSVMGRDLKAAVLTVGGRQLRVATSHLESPTGWDQLHSPARQAQCKQALAVLDRTPQDVLYVGDFNWSEKNDGPPPLPPGWVDAWAALHPGDPGFTYDAGTNAMLKRKRGGGLRVRLDRAFCKLLSWQLDSVEVVGKEAIPGESFEGKAVLPSDHYGLLLRCSC